MFLLRDSFAALHWKCIVFVVQNMSPTHLKIAHGIEAHAQRNHVGRVPDAPHDSEGGVKYVGLGTDETAFVCKVSVQQLPKRFLLAHFTVRAHEVHCVGRDPFRNRRPVLVGAIICGECGNACEDWRAVLEQHTRVHLEEFHGRSQSKGRRDARRQVRDGDANDREDSQVPGDAAFWQQSSTGWLAEGAHAHWHMSTGWNHWDGPTQHLTSEVVDRDRHLYTDVRVLCKMVAVPWSEV